MNVNTYMLLIILFTIVATCINVYLYNPTQRRVKKLFFIKVPIYSGEELQQRINALIIRMKRKDSLYRNGYLINVYLEGENINQRRFDFTYIEIIGCDNNKVYCGTDKDGKFHTEITYNPEAETYAQMWLETKGNPDHINKMLNTDDGLPNIDDKKFILNRYKNYILNNIL